MDDLWEVLEADGYPRALVEAVLRKVGTTEVVDMSGRISPDMTKSVRWVGATMLESLGQEITPISSFQEAWKNDLPEEWRAAATLDIIKVCCGVISLSRTVRY